MNTQEILTYINTDGEQIVFTAGSVYHVNVSQDVSGLTDLDVTIYSTSSNEQDGNTVVGTRIEPRSITVKGKILTVDKAAQLVYRRRLVKALNPRLAGTLVYQFGTFTKKIGAIVDGSPKFSHGTISQEFEITFSCADPFWRDDTDAMTAVAAWDGDWEFPVDITKDDTQVMIFGHHKESVIANVYNGGDIETGMLIRFTARGALTNPSLMNVDTRETMKINTSLAAGDVLEINTNRGSKGVHLTHGGTTTNAFRYRDPDSIFMQLAVGDNLFKYDAATGADNLECLIFYAQKYLGV